MAAVPVPFSWRGYFAQNLSATGYMLIAVVAFSLIPLAVSLAGGAKAPFQFNLWFRMGVAAGCLLFLLVFHRNVLFDTGSRSLIWSRLLKPPTNKFFGGTIISTFDFALLAWSVKYIDISIATILFEIWPVFMILVAYRLFEEEGRYRKITFTMLSLTLLSLAGFVFAIASQTVEVESVSAFIEVLWESRAGVGLVLAAIVATTFITLSWKWGAHLSREVSDEGKERSLELCYTVVLFFVVSVVASILSVGLALADGGRLSFDGWIVALIFGVVLSFGNIAWGKANFTTDNLGINALNYAIPILSLVWLLLFAQTAVARIDYLVMGAAAIVTANLLINFEAEIRWGFKALILSLGTGGAVVYLRDGVFDHWGVDKWHWTAGGYFEALALSATVFTLLLAFRVSRLISRTGEEENRTFSAFRRLDVLVSRRVIDRRVMDCLRRIDSPQNQVDLRNAYSEARVYILSAKESIECMSEVDVQLLAEAESNLDTLARSKQQDITPGEMFALLIFALITISLALASRPPETEGWTRLLVDLFAVLISAVVVFLVVNVWDLRRERDESKFEMRRGDGDLGIRFADTRLRSFDQLLSVIVGGALVVTFAGLLAHKWVGWFPWLG